MNSNFRSRARINRLAALMLVTYCFIQSTAGAQISAPPPERTKVGTTALMGLARGDMLRFTAFHPESADEPREPISMQMKLFDAQGTVIAESPEVLIPAGEFRYVDFHRDDLPLAGDADTGLAQVRTVPLWGCRARNRFYVTTSLEVFNSNPAAGRPRIFLTVESLP
jgi:hypothetical protein